MASWKGTHARLLSRLQRPGRGGAAFNLSLENFAVEYEPTTGSRKRTRREEIRGWAIAVEVDRGDQTVKTLTTLLFVPVTYGDTPLVGMVGTWGSTRRTIKNVRLIDPAGKTMAAHLVLE